MSIATVLCGVLLVVSRPPVLTDVPFPYDPNLCVAPLMDWMVVQPGKSVVYAIGVNNDGWDLVFTASLPIEPNQILLDYVGQADAPDGRVTRYWQIAWTVPPALGAVYYLHLRVSEIVPTEEGPLVRSDERTVLIKALGDDGPFIFPVHGPIPVSRMKDAQRTVQYAKKVWFPLTYHINVR